MPATNLPTLKLSCQTKSKKVPTFLALVLLSLCTSVAHAEELHQQIDRLISAAQIGPQSAKTTDAEFLRRLYLDLVGTIPSSDEARAFIEDKDPQKRSKLIDRLLTDSRHARHMAHVFDVMLMERRTDKHVKTPEWHQYLFQSFRDNKPLNQLAQEILSADGSNSALRPAAKFYLDRSAEPNLLTRDVGRIFFGVDLQCAQCHDHPLIENYFQKDYYGLYAFFNRGFLFTDTKKVVHYAEKAEGAVAFKSVFTDEAGKTRPRLLDSLQLSEPRFRLGESYAVKAAKGVRPIPKHSRRALLAAHATDGSHPAFNRNIANRVWAHMMGRGIVHPVDLHHAENPPTHPEVLNLITQRFVAEKFNLRAMLKELALTEVYQRSFQISQNPTASNAKIVEKVHALEAQHAKLVGITEQSAAAASKLKEQLTAAQKKLEPLDAELVKVTVPAAAARKKLDEAITKKVVAQAEVTKRAEALKLIAEASAKVTIALKALPSDADLTKVLATFAAKTKQFQTELPVKKKAVTDLMPAVVAAEQAFDAAHKPVEAVWAKLDATTKPIDALAAQVSVAEIKRKADQSTEQLAKARFDAALKFAEYTNLPTKIAASEQAIPKEKAAMPAATKAVVTMSAELGKRKANMVQAESVVVASTKILVAAQQQQSEKQAVIAAVADALKKTELASAKLPAEKGLIAALQTFKTKAGALNSQMAEVQKVVAEKASTVKQTTANRDAAKTSFTAGQTELAKLQKVVTDKQQNLQKLETQLAADKAAVSTTFETLGKLWTKEFAVSEMKPLTPEQMAWVILQSTGMVKSQYVAETAALNKTTPLKPEEQKNPAKLAERAAQLEQAVYGKLKGNMALFVRLYGAGPGQPQGDFFATADQALFFSNGGQIRGWAVPRGDNVATRMDKATAAKTAAEELYLSTLTRLPTAEEVAAVDTYLKNRKPEEKPAAIKEMIWALLTSAEFRFNH